MINPSQYSALVLEPTLKALKMYSIDAMYLMLRTAMAESAITHLKQLPAGPALGFMQLEPKTIADIYRYLDMRPEIKRNLLSFLQMPELPNKLDIFVYNLALNAAFARIKYWMIEEPLPVYKNIDGQGEYYKRYYNSQKGLGSVESFSKAASGLIGCIVHEL